MDPDHQFIYSLIEHLVKEEKERESQTRILTESLGLKERDVICLVGAGGKTTLMFRLANELLLSGKKVVTTTTTKIREPTSRETSSFFVHSEGEKIMEYVQRHLDRYHHITVAGERLEEGKVKGISPGLVLDLWELPIVDYLIVEADGAAGRPVKAPRDHEPVIPSNTTLVAAVLGIDGVDAELNEGNVFQPERVSRLTGIPLGGRLNAEAMAILMTHPEGIFKGTPGSARVVAFLNKVDLSKGLAKAEGVAVRILEKRHPQIERVVLGQLRSDPPVVKVIFLPS